MWSALHTARAIAQVTLPYFEQNNITKQIALIREILKDSTSPKDAFEKSMSIEWNEELNCYCHVIEMGKYNSYINEHIPVPVVADDCWGKYIPFRQKFFDSEDFYCNYLPYLEDIRKPQFLIVGEYDMTCGKFEQPEKYTDLITDFVMSLY